MWYLRGSAMHQNKILYLVYNILLNIGQDVSYLNYTKEEGSRISKKENEV